jgi:hypothetical protein
MGRWRIWGHEGKNTEVEEEEKEIRGRREKLGWEEQRECYGRRREEEEEEEEKSVPRSQRKPGCVWKERIPLTSHHTPQRDSRETE